jgi:acetyl-CoA synthetase
MTPYAVYSMLACARIGAVCRWIKPFESPQPIFPRAASQPNPRHGFQPHSVVFAGFSADALRSRIVNGNCRVVLTADEGVRGGKVGGELRVMLRVSGPMLVPSSNSQLSPPSPLYSACAIQIIPLRDTVHKALERCPDQVHSVIVHQRTGRCGVASEGKKETVVQERAHLNKACPGLGRKRVQIAIGRRPHGGRHAVGETESCERDGEGEKNTCLFSVRHRY